MDPAFALALLALDGVGRVTAHRVLERFPTWEALRACPREQVLVRVKGAPHAERLVGRLFDEAAMGEALGHARAEIDALHGKQIAVLTPGHPYWPAGLNDLSRGDRPVVLYAFGTTAALARPGVAFFGQAPLPGPAFEAAQEGARACLAAGIPVVVGARPGFDVVLHKLGAEAGAPCVMVAASGLARVDGPARPSISAAVRAGGVLLSPFPLPHGPFPHDDHERALVQAALAAKILFTVPREGSAEARALAWAAEAGRRCFVFPDGDAPLPPGAQRLDDPAQLVAP